MFWKNFFQRRFVQYLSGGIAAIGLQTILAMINSILTARLLGVAGKGQYTLLYSVINIFIAVGGLKLDFSQAYYIRKEGGAKILSSTIYLSLLAGSALILIGVPLIPYIKTNFLPDVDKNYILTMVLASPALLIAENLRSSIKADYDIPKSLIIFVSRPAFFLLFFAGLSLFWQATLTSSVYSIVLSILFMLVLAVFLAFRKYGLFMERPDISLLKGMMLFGFKSHIGNLFKFLQYRFDVFLLAYFLSAEQVGLYSVALAVAEILWKLPNTVSSILLPKLSMMEEKNTINFTARLNRIIFAITLLGVVALYFLAEFIVVLAFGNEFREAGIAVRWFLPGILALSIWKILHNDLIIKGKALSYSISVMVAVVVMVSLDIILIPSLGIIGAAIASSIAYMVSTFIVLYLVYKSNNLPLATYFNIFDEIGMLRGKL